MSSDIIVVAATDDGNFIPEREIPLAPSIILLLVVENWGNKY
ncbi:MAG: hypothetical protein ACRC2T_20045 [Thermoguttaceae bacterium]